MTTMTTAEALAAIDRVEATINALRTRCATLVSERDALRAEVEALRADAERLNWLDAHNIPKRMGWKVGTAPAGNVAVSSVVFLASEPVTIRAAIDAARAEARNG